MLRFSLFGAFLPALFLGACDLAPVYAPPAMIIPDHFKEGGIWHLAAPADDQPHGDWWRSFRDPLLNRLEEQVDAHNQTIAEAEANYFQARAFVGEAQSAFFPQIGFGASLSTNRQSDHRPLRSSSQPSHYGDNSLEINSSYEVDLWGRVRDTVSAAKAQAQAQGASLEVVRLGLHAELARDYVTLRGLDRQSKLLIDTAKAYADAYTLTQNRLAGKIAPPTDVSRAEAQLAGARAAIDDLRAARSLVEHAIASLIGAPASSFSILPAQSRIALPRQPSGVPSTLLERRPDIAEAERQVAIANERIGIARTAFYPRLFLSFQIGSQDTGLNLLDVKNEFYSVGPSLSMPIYDGGRRLAQLDEAMAAQQAAAAFYKNRVLLAIREVEDDLALDRNLGAEQKQLAEAVAADQRVLSLALSLYRDGATNYLDVVIAQTTAYEAERAAISLETRRLQAAIGLFVALGGGFIAPAPVIPPPDLPATIPPPTFPPPLFSPVVAQGPQQ